METQNGRSLGWSREIDHCHTRNQTSGYVEWGLGETNVEAWGQRQKTSINYLKKKNLQARVWVLLFSFFKSF